MPTLGAEISWACIELDGDVSVVNLTVLNSRVFAAASDRLLSIGASRFNPNGTCRVNISHVSVHLIGLLVNKSLTGGRLAVISFGAFNSSAALSVNAVEITDSAFLLANSSLVIADPFSGLVAPSLQKSPTVMATIARSSFSFVDCNVTSEAFALCSLTLPVFSSTIYARLTVSSVAVSVLRVQASSGAVVALSNLILGTPPSMTWEAVVENVSVVIATSNIVHTDSIVSLFGIRSFIGWTLSTKAQGVSILLTGNTRTRRKGESFTGACLSAGELNNATDILLSVSGASFLEGSQTVEFAAVTGASVRVLVSGNSSITTNLNSSISFRFSNLSDLFVSVDNSTVRANNLSMSSAISLEFLAASIVEVSMTGSQFAAQCALTVFESVVANFSLNLTQCTCLTNGPALSVSGASIGGFTALIEGSHFQALFAGIIEFSNFTGMDFHLQFQHSHAISVRGLVDFYCAVRRAIFSFSDSSFNQAARALRSSMNIFVSSSTGDALPLVSVTILDSNFTSLIGLYVSCQNCTYSVPAQELNFDVVARNVIFNCGTAFSLENPAGGTSLSLLGCVTTESTSYVIYCSDFTQNLTLHVFNSSLLANEMIFCALDILNGAISLLGTTLDVNGSSCAFRVDGAASFSMKVWHVSANSTSCFVTVLGLLKSEIEIEITNSNISTSINSVQFRNGSAVQLTFPNSRFVVSSNGGVIFIISLGGSLSVSVAACFADYTGHFVSASPFIVANVQLIISNTTARGLSLLTSGAAGTALAIGNVSISVFSSVIEALLYFVDVAQADASFIVIRVVSSNVTMEALYSALFKVINSSLQLQLELSMLVLSEGNLMNLAPSSGHYNVSVVSCVMNDAASLISLSPSTAAAYRVDFFVHQTAVTGSSLLYIWSPEGYRGGNLTVSFVDSTFELSWELVNLYFAFVARFTLRLLRVRLNQDGDYPALEIDLGTARLTSTLFIEVSQCNINVSGLYSLNLNRNTHLLLTMESSNISCLFRSMLRAMGCSDIVISLKNVLMFANTNETAVFITSPTALLSVALESCEVQHPFGTLLHLELVGQIADSSNVIELRNLTTRIKNLVRLSAALSTSLARLSVSIVQCSLLVDEQLLNATLSSVYELLINIFKCSTTQSRLGSALFVEEPFASSNANSSLSLITQQSNFSLQDTLVNLTMSNATRVYITLMSTVAVCQGSVIAIRNADTSQLAVVDSKLSCDSSDVISLVAVQRTINLSVSFTSLWHDKGAIISILNMLQNKTSSFVEVIIADSASNGLRGFFIEEDSTSKAPSSNIPLQLLFSFLNSSFVAVEKSQTASFVSVSLSSHARLVADACNFSGFLTLIPEGAASVELRCNRWNGRWLTARTLRFLSAASVSSVTVAFPRSLADPRLQCPAVPTLTHSPTVTSTARGTATSAATDTATGTSTPTRNGTITVATSYSTSRSDTPRSPSSTLSKASSGSESVSLIPPEMPPLHGSARSELITVASIAVATVLPSAGMAVQRAALFLRLTACEFSFADPLDVSSSPTGLLIGNEENGYFRGAVAGNWLIWAACGVCGYGLCAAIAWVGQKPVWTCAHQAELPGLLIVPFVFSAAADGCCVCDSPAPRSDRGGRHRRCSQCSRHCGSRRWLRHDSLLALCCRQSSHRHDRGKGRRSSAFVAWLATPRGISC